jgi:oxygen-independent coproporphyrinogen-3 oxidase
MLSLYLHIPFCASKCSYCDFNAYAGMSDLIAPYARALAKEVRIVGLGGEVHTLFFGGGTPSLTPLNSMADILSAIRESFILTDDCEVTLEANPGTVDLAYLEGLRALGVNRLSFGVQSAQANELALFNRIHTFDEACETVRLARWAGFDRQSNGVNLDLIYGIPGQTLEQWKDTLARALALEPEHLSLYSLSLEFGTPMRVWVQRGLLSAPDNNVAADMYEWADAELTRAGFEQYEISNWARVEDGGQRSEVGSISDLRPLSSNFQCRHNLQYWRNEPYLGFGAGAHGCTNGFRYSNVLSPAAYIQRIESGEPRPFPFSPALAEATPVDTKTAMDETMMLGFRLTREGIPADAFRARYGVGFDEVYARELRDLTGRQLIEVGADRARLTTGARLVANRVFEKFV